MAAAQCYGPWAKTIARDPLGSGMISPPLLRFILVAARFQNGAIPGSLLRLYFCWWVRLMIGHPRHPESPLRRVVAGGLKRIPIQARIMISTRPIHRSVCCAALAVPQAARRPSVRILRHGKMHCAACRNFWRA